MITTLVPLKPEPRHQLSETQVAEARQAVNVGLLHLAALLGLDWQSASKQRLADTESNFTSHPEVAKARQEIEAVKKLADDHHQKAAGPNGLHALRQEAVRQEDAALAAGIAHDAKKWNCEILKFDVLLAEHQNRSTEISTAATEADKQYGLVSRRVRRELDESLPGSLRAEHSKSLDDLIAALDRPSIHKKLIDLAVAADMRVKLRK